MEKGFPSLLHTYRFQAQEGCGGGHGVGEGKRREEIEMDHLTH